MCHLRGNGLLENVIIRRINAINVFFINVIAFLGIIMRCYRKVSMEVSIQRDICTDLVEESKFGS